MKKLNLVLLPGLLCDADLWEPQVADLGDVMDPAIGDITGHDSIAALIVQWGQRDRLRRFRRLVPPIGCDQWHLRRERR